MDRPYGSEASYSEADLAVLLAEVISESREMPLDSDVRSFAEDGLLTMNEGLVLRVGDGEFQLTIVRSR